MSLNLTMIHHSDCEAISTRAAAYRRAQRRVTTVSIPGNDESMGRHLASMSWEVLQQHKNLLDYHVQREEKYLNTDEGDPDMLDHIREELNAVKHEIARRQNNLLSAIFNPDSED